MNQDEIVLKVLENIDLHRPHQLKLKHYYDGKHSILFEKGKSDPTKSDMRAYFILRQ